MKKFLQNFFLVLISTFFIFIFLEICLRIFGLNPYKTTYSRSPEIYKKDKILGWDTKYGNHKYQIDENTHATFNFLEDGSRYSGKKINNLTNLEKIILIGGSFTMGHKINDEETIGFYLQNEHKNYEVKNYGVGGFGTFQSYLKLKKIIKKNENIRIVIYFFIDNHEIRNIGDVTYLEKTSQANKKLVYLPYVSLDENNDILEHKPEKYLVIPFSNYSVLLTKIQKKIMRFIIKSNYTDRQIITKKLISKIDNLSKKNNIKFLFVNLASLDAKNLSYKKFLEENDILFLDCRIKDFKNYTNSKIDMHPNNLANKEYSKCLKDLIIEQIASSN